MLLTLVFPLAAIAGGDGAAIEGASVDTSYPCRPNCSAPLQEATTSATGEERAISETPAPAYVLDCRDLRRAGVTNLAEAMRMVPGMEVARLDTNSWAVSSRGLNGPSADRTLVTIDGRPVNNGINGAVDWEAIEMPIEEIERIEIVRGPSAAMMGMNPLAAIGGMNGSINIVTRNSADTQGVYATAGLGGEERGLGARYGGRIGDRFSYRVNAGYTGIEGFSDFAAAGEPGIRMDTLEGNSMRGGFRMDARPNENNGLTFTGGVYSGTADQEWTLPYQYSPFERFAEGRSEFQGGHLTGAWNHRIGPRSDMTFGLTYDRADREDIVLGQRVESATFGYAGNFRMNRNNLVWGAGYRHIQDHLRSTSVLQVADDSETTGIATAFVADEVSFLNDKLRVTFGTGIQHNEYTGVEITPGVRALYAATPRQTYWAGITRGVGIPDRFDRDLSGRTEFTRPAGATLPLAYEMRGNHSIDAESVISYEAGYRFQMKNGFAIDATAFYNRYDDLLVRVPGTPYLQGIDIPNLVVQPFDMQNLDSASSQGIEVAAYGRVGSRWTWRAGVTALRNDISDDLDRMDPQLQASFRSFLDLPGKVELDSGVYWVDEVRAAGIPAYCRMDVRVGWRPIRGFEFAITGRNLFDGGHREFGVPVMSTNMISAAMPSASISNEVPRSILATVTYRF